MLRVVYFLGVAVVVRGQREHSREPDPHWWVAILLLLILILAFMQVTLVFETASSDALVRLEFLSLADIFAFYRVTMDSNRRIVD